MFLRCSNLDSLHRSLRAIPLLKIDQFQIQNVDRADLQPRKCVSVVNVSWLPTKVSQEKTLFFLYLFSKVFCWLIGLFCLGNAACFSLSNLFPWQKKKIYMYIYIYIYIWLSVFKAVKLKFTKARGFAAVS